jgi:galactose mutarotase-like enzyme
VTKSEQSDAIVLACGEARATVWAVGAELCAWRADGLDLLWAPDPRIWPAVSPILFPIVGHLRGGRLRVGAHETRLETHGFAARTPFTLERRERDSARFVLRDSAQTQAIFPFSFALTVDYRLTEAQLVAALGVQNTGETALPYACGLHPGFRWPFDGGAIEDYRLVFEAPESNLVPKITREGLFAGARRAVPLQDRVLPLSRELLASEALCFLDARSRSFRFLAPSGRSITIETENFPHFALWARPPADFLCLESWTGHGDPADFTGDVFSKPSMRLLAPGARARHEARYALA